MMIAIVKFLHIAAISIWAAGIISLPGLYVQRANVGEGDNLHRLQRIVRFAYTGIISPAAFTAILTGTGLIFLRDVFEGWFSIKLGFVALLAIIHVLTGLVVIRLFRDGEIYPVWRFVLVTIATTCVVLAILFVVLAKPHIDIQIPAVMSEPGGLYRLYLEFSPWATP